MKNKKYGWRYWRERDQLEETPTVIDFVKYIGVGLGFLYLMWGLRQFQEYIHYTRIIN